MTGKFYSLIFFLLIFWFMCLYIGFKSQKKITTPVEFFIYGRQIPGWSFLTLMTGSIFSIWIFFLQPGLVFLNGLPFALTSLFVITIPLSGILFSKRQWMLSKRFGFVTPPEMLSTYFKSDIIRILIVVITLGFAIPFIAMQLSIAGLLISILTDNIIGIGSGAILVGAIAVVYLSSGGIKSLIYIDAIQLLLVIFGIFCLGFFTYDLIGGWDLLNESLSRIANLKANFFNLKENFKSYLSVPGTIKIIEVSNNDFTHYGIWSSSMILTFAFALIGLQISPNSSMLTFSSKDVGYFANQQIWFSAFLIGFLLIFFTIGIGTGSALLGANSIINESGNNISNILPPNIYPNDPISIVPHLINLIGEYSVIFFGILAICALAAVQSANSLYLTSSAIFIRDIIKRFFIKNLNGKQQIFGSRIIMMLIFIMSLCLSLLSAGAIIALGSFSLAVACQMFVPLLALCYFSWFTKQGVSFGIAVGIIAIIFTESIGQEIFGDIIFWNKWPLSIHSSFWGLLFNLIATTIISFITQETKETNHKQKFHDFIKDYKSYSLGRRSLKPSAWMITITWVFFALGPGLMMGNELFGKPSNVESWSFGIPSIWVWIIAFWILGILLTWFLAIKMEMLTSPDKNIVSQTEDIGSGFRG